MARKKKFWTRKKIIISISICLFLVFIAYELGFFGDSHFLRFLSTSVGPSGSGFSGHGGGGG
jgi:hypothetical protein